MWSGIFYCIFSPVLDKHIETMLSGLKGSNRYTKGRSTSQKAFYFLTCFLKTYLSILSLPVSVTPSRPLGTCLPIESRPCWWYGAESRCIDFIDTLDWLMDTEAISVGPPKLPALKLELNIEPIRVSPINSPVSVLVVGNKANKILAKFVKMSSCVGFTRSTYVFLYP